MTDNDPSHTRCPACDAYVPAPSEVCLQCGAAVQSQAGSEGDDGDFLERLERLHQIHVAGGLTDEEFATAKARLLGETPAPGASPAPLRAGPDAALGPTRAGTFHAPSASLRCPQCQSHFVSRLRFFEKKNRKLGVGGMGCMGCFLMVAVLVLTPAVLLLGAALGSDVVGNLAVPLLILLVVASAVGFVMERSKAGMMICEACGHRFRADRPPSESADQAHE